MIVTLTPLRRRRILLFLLSLAAPATLCGYARWSLPRNVFWRGDNNRVLFRVDTTVQGGLLNVFGHTLITPDSDPRTALAAAMNTWNSVASTTARFLPLDVGPTRAYPGDGQNSFSFEDDEETRSIVGSAIAITRVITLYDGSVVDTDILFSPSYSFSTTRYAGSMDLQEIATHELGHSLGVEHSNLFTSTMFPFADFEQTFRRRLSDDDIAFVSVVYPLAAPNPAGGTISGTISFDSGSPVRGAAVVAVDAERGVVVSAITRLGDGRYTMAGLPPGNYRVHSEPIRGMVQPSNLGLSESQVDLGWPATTFGGAATPQVVSVSQGLTVKADIVVPFKPPTLQFSFLAVNLNQYSAPAPDSDLLHSGQSAEISIFGTGYDDSIEAEDILVFGSGISVRPGSLEVFPGATPADTGQIIFVIDIPARDDWSIAFFGVRRGDENLFTNPLRITPAGPTFRPSGVTNAAWSEHVGLAPGEIASLYGTALGPAEGLSSSPSAGRLPRTLAGVTLSVDDLRAPLFYVASGQISFLVPYEVAGRTSVTLSVTVNGSVSDQATLPVLDAAPALFPVSYGWAVINRDWTMNSPASPAPAGSVIMVYCTGLGAVSPPIDSGAVAPQAPLSSAVGVTASLNGTDAPVNFAGLAPGFVGLMQVNAAIPAATPKSDALPLILTAHGQSSQSWVTIAVN